jgi:aminomethyltransferase
MNFMTSLDLNVIPLNVDAIITRCGYTGEDGFEISITSQHATNLAALLLKHNDVKLAGLGSRDTLRLEAGFCLYDQELKEDISPIEANLAWCIGRRRREPVSDNNPSFPGYDIIMHQLLNSKEVNRKRCGLIIEGAPARTGAIVISKEDGSKIGEITSGIFSPSLKKNIAMGYLLHSFHKIGTEVKVIVHGREQNAVVVKLPFVPNHYFKVNSH